MENKTMFTRERMKRHVTKMMSNKKSSMWCIKLLQDVDAIFNSLENSIDAHIDRIKIIGNKIEANPTHYDESIEYEGLIEGIYMGHVGRLVKQLSDCIQNNMQLEENLLAEELMLEIINETRNKA